MKYLCKNIIGPYNGPYTRNMKTYFLYDLNNKKILWHEGPNKCLNCKIGDIIEGIVIDKNGYIDYKNSNITIIKNGQLEIF